MLFKRGRCSQSAHPSGDHADDHEKRESGLPAAYRRPLMDHRWSLRWPFRRVKVRDSSAGSQPLPAQTTTDRNVIRRICAIERAAVALTAEKGFVLWKPDDGHAAGLRR